MPYLRIFRGIQDHKEYRVDLNRKISPYKPTTVLVQAVAATDDSPAVLEHTTVKTPMNMSPANKAHFEAEKEAIHLILTGIGDEIYSTVDACQTARKMWEAIERLQQARMVKKEVNELRDERLVRNANPLALVDTAQTNQDPYYQTSKSHKSYAPSSKPSIPTRSHTTTRYKGKEIAKPITPPSKTASEEDSDPKHAKRDKDMQKNLALITKKPKRVKDFACHKEKMLLCKQAEKGVLLQAEQYDWLADTDEEIDEQELEAHYSYMAKIQEVPTADTLEMDDRNVIPNSPDMCDDDIQNDQNDVESDDERVTIANLIANLKLIKTPRESNSVWDSCLVALQNKQTEFEKYKAFNDRTVDYDKLEQIVDNAWIKHSKDQFCAPTAQDMEILIQACLMPFALMTQNDGFIFVHELKQEMHAYLKYVESLENKIDELESDKAEFLNKYDMILQESKGKSVETKFDKPSVVQQPNPQRIPKPSVLDAHVPSQQELDLLFGPLYNEFFTAVSSSVNKSSSPINNSNQQDTQPITNIQSTLAPSTHTYVHAEENNNNQAEEEHLQDDEFSNPFCIRVQEVNESSSYNIGNLNVPTFNQSQVSEYQWTKDHSLEQVHGNPSKPVQTRRQLATDLEMCMFALTMSTTEPKNIKEAMADSAWIEAMQEELYQFDRLQV
nr:hypothetical protein [Tanacetum cinerariifolium]